MGKRAPQWSDPNEGAEAPPAGLFGKTNRTAAIDLGRLRSQLRGHDLGLDAQVTPLSSPRRNGRNGRSKTSPFEYAQKRPLGFANKMRSLTTNVYSQESLPNRYKSSQPRMRASASMHTLGAGNGRGLPMSRSMPEGAMMPEGIDGPTVAGGEEADESAADETTGPAPPSGTKWGRQQQMPRLPRRVPWSKDKRCDPNARFYEPPNVDHLLYAEEI